MKNLGRPQNISQSGNKKQSPKKGSSRNIAQLIMRSWLCNIIARPWLDKLILKSLEHWYFPLSRLWAAARRADGNAEVFYTHVPLANTATDRHKTQHALDHFESTRATIAETEQQWRESFFSSTNDISEDELLALENLRLAHRSHYNATRQKFKHLRKQVKLSVHKQFATPKQLNSVYGGSEQDWQKRFAEPESFPEVICSKSITENKVKKYWIHFDSPSKRLNDQVYARVTEPEGVENPPTLIFGHGIGVEFDHWRNMIDVIDLLPSLGIRVIRPEGPWHGRRVPDGFYGGEYFLSTIPMGAFDLFTGQYQEWLVLMDWARNTSSAPVAMGGSSLGAQCAQTNSIRANVLPKRLQPDALFLMTHCTHVWEVAMDSDLADIWGLHQPLHDLGWTREHMEQWLMKLDPNGVPCMAPENIISVLGKYDRVTPFKSGKRLQQLWNLPEENTYAWPCGHFTVPMHMLKHTQPILHLKAIFDRLMKE